MSNAMSLKAKIRNIAKQKSIPAQVILQNYMFERLLVRLSASEYREKFVLKGGMLVAATLTSFHLCKTEIAMRHWDALSRALICSASRRLSTKRRISVSLKSAFI